MSKAAVRIASTSPRKGGRAAPKQDPAAVPTLSVVVPVFNECEVIEATYRELRTTLDRLNEAYEILFVDDGSRDGSRDILIRLSEGDPRIRVIVLARNFGHETATTVGMHQAAGKAVVVIDADLQDPPELILEMVRRWREGFEVVYGVRSQRDGESLVKRVTSYCFYRLMAGIADFPFPADAGDFRLMDRRVVDIYRSLKEDPRFFRGLISWIGFRQTGLQFRRRPRAAGVSKYRYNRLVKLAFDTVTAFSSFPAQLVLGLSAAALALSVVTVAVALVGGLVGRWPMDGTFWMAGVCLFVLNLQFAGLAILGQYLVRTHRNTQGRPLYIVESIHRNGTKE